MSSHPLRPDPGQENVLAWESGHFLPAESDDNVSADPGAVTADDLLREFPELREYTIDGLLREGETMNMVAAPKIGKSWLAHSLLASVLTGQPWFGKATRAGRVLLIDGELHAETLAMRLREVATTLGVRSTDLARMDIWMLRGKRWTIDTIAKALSSYPAGTFRLIVIDALYRFLPVGGEENSNETMTQVYNSLDAIAKGARTAIVVIHHATKGDQSGKAITDIGAGGGAQSRAPDTHLILRPHAEDGAVVVEAVVRSFAPPEAFVLRSCNPGWELAPDLDPALLRKPKPRRQKAQEQSPKSQPRVWTPDEFATQCVGPLSIIREDVIANGLAAGLSKSNSVDLLKRAVAAMKVFRVVVDSNEPHRFTTQVPDSSPLPAGRGGSDQGVPGGPPPPERSAPGGMGGTRVPPLPPSPETKKPSRTSKKRKGTP